MLHVIEHRLAGDLFKNKLLTTVAYRLRGKVTYGIEGSVFSSGVTIKWLRDSLKLIRTAAETEQAAKRVIDTGGVYLVPAFTGLGAPYWDPHARGALLGLTQNTSIDHVVRAALESVCYQMRDLLNAAMNDGAIRFEALRVDGGMAANNWLLQFLADILNVTVQRPVCVETSALGVAFLAGLQVGIYASLDEIASLWHANANFAPEMQDKQRTLLYDGWQKAVARVLT